MRPYYTTRRVERDYKKEYEDYSGKPQQIRERASRNQARAIMVELYGLEACKNKQVDHIDHNPMNNNINNLRLLSLSQNMSDNKHKT